MNLAEHAFVTKRIPVHSTLIGEMSLVRLQLDDLHDTISY
jgi:hypothetical protein